MRYTILILVLALSGCAWQKAAKITLTSHEAALAAADKTGLDHYNKKCRDIAKKCPPGSDDKTCKPLGKCWKSRRTLQGVLDKAALGIAAGWTAAAAGDQKGWDAIRAILEGSMDDLSKMLRAAFSGGAL